MPSYAVLVLGMHRSGTSALTETLMRLGAQGPATPTPASDDNPLGFGESQRLCQFHDRMLQAAATTWDDWNRFDEHRLGGEAQPLANELRSIVASEFGRPPLFAVKDPRICRFASWWMEQLTADYRIGVVLAVRHPNEVASSLQRRDGMSRDVALLIWLRHVLDAERQTRRMPRAVVHYADLLRHWRQSVAAIERSLQIGWPRHPDRISEDVSRLLRPDLRHHVASDAEVDAPIPLLDWTTETYRILLALARHNITAAQAAAGLDHVRISFEEHVSLIEEASRRKMRVAMQAAASASEGLKARISELTRDREALAARATVLAEERAALTSSVQVMAAQRDALSHELADLRNRFDTYRDGMARAVESLDRMLRDLRGSRSWRWTAPLRRAVTFLRRWRRR